VSGSRHARKSLGEGEAGLAARGPFHWPSQLVSASRLACCAQVPESGDESSRVTLANHRAIPAIYEDREFVDDVGGSPFMALVRHSEIADRLPLSGAGAVVQRTSLQ